MKGQKSWVALKLDKGKAYDKTEWVFLLEVLNVLGFHPKWVDLIERITTFSYSINVNNDTCGFFKPTKRKPIYVLFV